MVKTLFGNGNILKFRSKYAKCVGQTVMSWTYAFLPDHNIALYDVRPDHVNVSFDLCSFPGSIPLVERSFLWFGGPANENNAIRLKRMSNQRISYSTMKSTIQLCTMCVPHTAQGNRTFIRYSFLTVESVSLFWLLICSAIKLPQFSENHSVIKEHTNARVEHIEKIGMDRSTIVPLV